MCHPQISTIASCFNTSVPLSDDNLCYSASNLTPLNDLSVTYLSLIDTTSIQEPRQALEQLVITVQQLLENPQLTPTAKVVDCDHLRQQHNQE
jgi:G3E family GTPase